MIRLVNTRKLPIITELWTYICSKGFQLLVGLFSGELSEGFIIGGKECVSKWVGLDKKKSA